MRRFPGFRRWIGVLGMNAILLSCTSYRDAMTGEITSGRARQVRLIMADQSRLVLAAPHLEHDTIFGYPVDLPQDYVSGRLAIPTEGVRRVQVRGYDRVKTLGLALAVAFLCFPWN